MTTSELRKRWNLDALVITNKFKEILRIDTLQNNETLGLSDCCKVKDDGDLIVADRKDTILVMQDECEVDQQIGKNKINLFQTGRSDDIKHNNVYKQICEIDNIKLAYELISKKKGANTLGIGKETLDSYSKETVESLIKSLKDHSFKFKPIRRVFIPKANGEQRPLGIPGPRDKIVQKAACNVLEKIYEKIFSKHSYGFRSGKGTHTCLKEISGWTGVNWFIEGDIRKYFDTINHQILEKLLCKVIDDKEFIDFYWKAVKVKYVDIINKCEEYSEIGTPQGGTISPILSNIYLHELDLFMENKIHCVKNSGPTSIENPEYKKIHTKISNLRQYFFINYKYKKTKDIDKLKRIEEIKKLEKERSKIKSKISGNGVRIYYVRYADDFIVGVTGSKELAEELKKEIQEFLEEKLKLTLNMEKTKITDAEKSRALFLGANIRVNSSRTYDQKKTERTSKNRIFKARIPVGKILILAPLERITKKLESQGICKIRNFANRDVIPTRKVAWFNLSLSEIIKKYNEISIGIINYYSFAYNRCQLNFIQYLIQHSAACTIMNKMKLNSRAQVFKKYGSSLIVDVDKKGKKIELKLQKSLPWINKFQVTAKLPYEEFNKSIRTNNNILYKACTICNTYENVEMHHRRGLKNKFTDNTLKGIKKNLSRKQIPLCRSCHMKVHNGQYDGPGIY